jgi:hypothetical protein
MRSAGHDSGCFGAKSFVSYRIKTSLDPQHLVRLRLVVARFGEMDVMGWWNTNGLLGRPGRTVFSRGFSRSHAFARARAAFAVASARCQSLFAPPGCITLWTLPAEIEDMVDTSWLRWCREPDLWTPFFERLEGIHANDTLADLLQSLDLIPSSTLEAAKGLRRSTEGKTVPLPGTGGADPATIMLLAAGFAKGEPQKPVIPYIRLPAE